MAALKIKSSAPGLNVRQDDMGRANTLRYNVICFVVEESYDKAIEEMHKFLEMPSPYPGFHARIERYVNHGVDLINAIRAKRKFPGVHSLTMAKQQELKERFHEHFNELQYVLRKIEQVQDDLRLEDIRSTVLVIRALVNVVFAIAFCGFMLEAYRGLGGTAWFVLNDTLQRGAQLLFKLLGL